MTLNLSVDEVLTTTRSVRNRLDLEKPVPRKVLLECLELAIQAPTGSNAQGWQWVFVEDADKKTALADIYKRGAEWYRKMPRAEYPDGDIRGERMEAVTDSALYLAEHLDEVPVLMIPCLQGRVVLGVALPGGVEFLPGSALPRSRVVLDDLPSARRGRKADRRGARHSVRRVQPGRAVSHRLHQGHRLPAGQAAAG